MPSISSAALAASLLALLASAFPADLDRQAIASLPVMAPACEQADPDPPAYYAIDLFTTGRVPGSRRATGVANVTFRPSPFGVALSATGTYVYDLAITVENLAPALNGAYVAWATTPDLSTVERLGTLDDSHQIGGRVEWNKFLVVVSLEADPEAVERWSGPIVLRGMSRSGMMHTMAGHGPFETEPCAVYGYQ
ncbi:hypothetical protein [Rubrivirga sp. IMCC43871]|uniref:hypothetical protein n=1 Tax=Rubrivirga sp. IMCC43871 TaxID=3391575 RepID=UPI00398FDDCE